MKGAMDLADWRQKIMTNWDQVRIERVNVKNGQQVPVAESLQIEADIFLNQLGAEDVDVEIYCGPLDLKDEFADRTTVRMQASNSDGNGRFQFHGEIPCEETGKYGFTIRVLPSSRKLEAPYTGGLVIWADEETLGSG
jgi:starch phosphorylase